MFYFWKQFIIVIINIIIILLFFIIIIFLFFFLKNIIIKKNIDRKDSSTPSQSVHTDSVSSAYPSPPNSIKTISSAESLKENTLNDHIRTTTSTSTGAQTTKTKFVPSTITITTEPMNFMSTDVYTSTSSNLSDSNSINESGNSHHDDQRITEDNGNSKINLNNDNYHNFTLYEIDCKLEDFKLINHTNQDISSSIPLEFNLTENNGNLYFVNFFFLSFLLLNNNN